MSHTFHYTHGIAQDKTWAQDKKMVGIIEDSQEASDQADKKDKQEKEKSGGRPLGGS
jgi:hypothetical protein